MQWLEVRPEKRALPRWLKIRPPTGKFSKIKEIIKQHDLNTVCEEAHCPNLSECWSGGTATFMVMGDTCTRACKFCAVKTGFPAKPLNSREPENLANAIAKMNLDYVVITSVDRDDLKDQGAFHFAKCVKKIKEKQKITVEALIPDFKGNEECLMQIIESGADVIAHNVETVERLQHPIRDPRANYDQSLKVLRLVKQVNPKIFTKSSIMLGLGEKDEEVIQTMKDLRKNQVDMLTIGQYLRPSIKHAEVKEYVTPEKFDYFRNIGLDLGFIYVASGPFVRSSYRSGEFFVKSIVKSMRAENA